MFGLYATQLTAGGTGRGSCGRCTLAVCDCGGVRGGHFGGRLPGDGDNPALKRGVDGEHKTICSIQDQMVCIPHAQVD